MKQVTDKGIGIRTVWLFISNIGIRRKYSDISKFREKMV